MKFAVSVHISILKLQTPLLPPLSIVNLTTLILCRLTTTFQTFKVVDSYVFRSLVHAIVKAHKSTHISDITPILKSLHWLKVNERTEYKLLFLTYKVLTTSKPSYLYSLISLQPPRSIWL